MKLRGSLAFLLNLKQATLCVRGFNVDMRRAKYMRVMNEALKIAYILYVSV